MTVFFRKYLMIAFVAAISCQLSYHVDAHCFLSNGKPAHNGWVHGCDDPTVSPAPTESPAPSPSPSAFPTDTQAPSVSLAPSGSPTNAPTTSEPSSSPSAPPTESPAPSPSPSAVPSQNPTISIAPSDKPSNSPSVSPTELPSVSPTENPSTSPSESPTGPIILTVLDVEFMFQNVTGDREMSPQNVQFFERTTTSYLQNHVEEAPGVRSIEVENVVVTNQNLVKHEHMRNGPLLRRQRLLEEESPKRTPIMDSQTDLIITIDVVVSVLFNRSESLRLNEFFEEFFEMAEHKNELRDMMERDESFAQGIFVKTSIESSQRSSSPSPSEKSNRTAIAGAVLGVVAFIVGSGLIWMWAQTRRRRSNDSTNLKNFGTISKSFESEDRRLSISNFYPKRDIEHSDSNDDSENGLRRKSTLTPLMYIPALMPTESNIEVPDTPNTAFAVNGFATPASAAGFMTPANGTGFMTPRSTKSSNFSTASIPKLLGESTPDPEPSPANASLATNVSKIKKVPLPSKIRGPLKSPFRQKTQPYDSSSFSGVGVVAGENNAGKRKKLTPAEMVLRDLPMEIGGPSSGPKPTVIPVEDDLVIRPDPSAEHEVVHVQEDKVFRLPTGRNSYSVKEDIVFRPPSGRKSNKYSRSPRHTNPQDMIAGADDTDLRSTRSVKSTKTTRSSRSTKTTRSSRSAKKRDHSDVDIVDEIAYLYSSNDPERYTDST